MDYGIFNELSKCCRGADSQRAIFRLCYSPQLCQIVDINNMAIAVIVMVKLYQYVSATASNLACGLSASRVIGIGKGGCDDGKKQINMMLSSNQSCQMEFFI